MSQDDFSETIGTIFLIAILIVASCGLVLGLLDIFGILDLGFKS